MLAACDAESDMRYDTSKLDGAKEIKAVDTGGTLGTASICLPMVLVLLRGMGLVAFLFLCKGLDTGSSLDSVTSTLLDVARRGIVCFFLDDL